MSEDSKHLIGKDFCRLYGHEPVQKIKNRPYHGVLSYVECERCGERLG